jgi:cryptochrome 1
MRELWATGWAHNRIRVVVASFSVKFLQLPWRWGMKYFWDVLLDADLECDILGWQYISGSLPDGHELDRIEDPQVEGYRFDPDGDYVRRWLPELSRLPNEWIHHPWDAPPGSLRAAGVELGVNYPRPIVEIEVARERLHASLTEMWERDAVMKAELANGLEEGLGETMEVVGTGGPLHERMDVPRVIVQRDADLSSISSRRDQLVPEIVPNEYHLQAHESIMNRSATGVEDMDEAVVTVPPSRTPERRGANPVMNPTNHVGGNNGYVAPARAPVAWPTVTAMDYDLDSTAESSSVAGPAESAGGTVPVWSEARPARPPVRIRQSLVPVVPEVFRAAGLSRRQLHASVQRVNIEAMTSNKTSSLSV